MEGTNVPKTLLIYSDGTGQAGGLRPDQRLSNIYKLYRATRSGPASSVDPSEQVAFYDPGLGTISDAGGVRLNALDKLLAIFGLATGMGITENIIDCYSAILKHYRPGDRICLFGFSRGAYTVRCVAGVLRLCGVPTHDDTGAPLPTDGPQLRKIAKEAVVNVYERRLVTNANEKMSASDAAAVAFRAKYGSDGEDDASSNAAPAFIGVFDTVAALGATGWRLVGVVAAMSVVVALFSLLAARIVDLLLPWLPYWNMAIAGFVIVGLYLGLTLFNARWKARGYDLSLDPRTGYARHARAIDETRAAFDVVGWGHSEDVGSQHREHGPWLVQLWFSGNHSDIGGSYPEDESRLSDITLGWMIGELALRVPVSIDWTKLNVCGASDGLQHCEVQYSKEAWWRPTWRSKDRKVHPEAPLHSSVLERLNLPSVPHSREWKPYQPAALRDHEAASRCRASSGKDAAESTANPSLATLIQTEEARCDELGK